MCKHFILTISNKSDHEQREIHMQLAKQKEKTRNEHEISIHSIHFTFEKKNKPKTHFVRVVANCG